MLRPKMLIYLAVWKRPEITEICFMGLERIRKAFGIEAFSVISEESMKPICKKYQVEYCMHENQPLGLKKNFGLHEALKRKSFDYIVEIGSDDLLKNEFFDVFNYTDHVQQLRNIAVLDTQTLDCIHLSGKMTGVGRMISREAIEAMVIDDRMKLWIDGQNAGLDTRSTMRLCSTGYGIKNYLTDEPLAVDLKSGENIWSYDHLKGLGESYDHEKVFKGLSDQEVNGIRALTNVAV